LAINKEIKHLDKSNVMLSITVPKDDIQAKYNEMMKEYTKTLQLPGFRKGKVPRDVLEKKYSEALKGDAMGRIMESAMQEVFKEENMPRSEKPLPYSTPELQGEPVLDLEQDLRFSVIYDVLPEVKLSQWKGLSAEYSYAEVEESDISKELEELRERNAIIMDRDEATAAASGDVVTVDYMIYEENGEPPEESNTDNQREDFTFTLGAAANAFKFDDDIIGMKKGEKKEFQKKFDDDFVIHKLAGHTRKVEISLTSLKEKKLPDLDDDLAQDVDEKFKTFDDLKNSVKQRLQNKLDARLRDKKINELLKIIMESAPVVIPESMLNAEIEGRWRRVARYYNTSIENIRHMMRIGEKEDQWREEAQKALHSRLIIETLMEEQKIEVSDEDLEKEFESIAAANDVSIEEIKKHYDENALLYLKEDIKEKKITDILLAENNFKPGKKENYLDFMTDNG